MTKRGRLGVVVKDLARNAAQGFEQRMMTSDQCLGAFIGGEACPAPTTEAERGGEGVKRIGASTEDNEIARTCQEFRVLRSVKRSQLMAVVNRSPNRMAN